MLNKGGERGHPCFVSDPRGNAFSFPFDINGGFLYMAFIILNYIPSILTLLRIFIINRH